MSLLSPTKQNFQTFLARLHTSASPTSQNLYSAIRLTIEGFQAAQESNSSQVLAEAANTVANAFMCDHRALSLVQDFGLESSPSMFYDSMKKLVHHGVPHECFTHSLLLYATLRLSGNLTPEDGIAHVNTLTHQLSSAMPVQECDIGQLNLFLSTHFAQIGDEARVSKSLKLAVEMAEGTLCGDSALLFSCKRSAEKKGRGESNEISIISDSQELVKALRYLAHEMHEDDPEYATVCSLLRDALFSHQKKDDQNEAIKKEREDIQQAQTNSRLKVQQLYGPFLLYERAADAGEIKAALDVFHAPPTMNSANAADPADPTPDPTPDPTADPTADPDCSPDPTAEGSKLRCASCGNDDQAILKSCSRCGTVQYCSTKCQSVDWKQGGHKKKCHKPFPFPHVAKPEVVFARMRKYIQDALENQEFIAWWEDMSLEGRRKVILSAMEDMPLSENDEMSILLECTSTFKNIFPELYVERLCSFGCQCGSCETHGNVPAVLFHLMHLRSARWQDARALDMELICPLYTELNEAGIEMALKSKEETFYQLLVHIVSFWKESFGIKYSSNDDGNVLSTPNLIMRAVGCALCGEDVPDKGELQGGAERCMVCCAIFWCSQECKQQGTKLHKCPGTVQVPHVLRANCFDCMIAASE